MRSQVRQKYRKESENGTRLFHVKWNFQKEGFLSMVLGLVEVGEGRDSLAGSPGAKRYMLFI